MFTRSRDATSSGNVATIGRLSASISAAGYKSVLTVSGFWNRVYEKNCIDIVCVSININYNIIDIFKMMFV